MERKGIKQLLSHMVLEGWHPFVWIAGACFFLYVKTLAFRFTCFDDNLIILNYHWFLKDLRNIFTVFTQSVLLGGTELFYRPLLVASFILDARAGGTAPAMYHCTNILLHAAASSLVFVLFGRMGYGRRLAFALSLLFLVHPALSQAVAWIPGRNDSLLAVFLLASFIAIIDYGRERGTMALLLHLLFFNLALYTKESAFVLAPLCLLYLVFIEKPALSRAQWGMIAAGWLLSGLGYVLMNPSEATHVSNALLRRDILTSIRDIPLSLLQYAGKTLFPFNLSGYPLSRDTGSLYGFAALAVLAAALVMTSRARIRRSLFGIAWFLLFLLPSLVLSDPVRLEHRLYVPIVGIFMVLGSFVRSHSSVFSRQGCLAAAGSVILLFSGITFVHSDIFMSGITFWENAVRTSPHSADAHNNLGVRYAEMGKRKAAEREFETAVQLRPPSRDAIINLGILYTEMGDYAAANGALTEALRRGPRTGLAWYHLGLLRYLQGYAGEAQRCWEQALRCDPYDFDACRTLAAFHYLRGDAAAVPYLKKCRDTFGRPIDIPAGATLSDRKWLYRFSLG